MASEPAQRTEASAAQIDARIAEREEIDAPALTALIRVAVAHPAG
ncbi:MAG TPA: hypothetical protein VFN55_10700 [Solirubrobacteraceae bacterium]|nr:hypothetical protein [Solirubrobacteraceae bacterium]